MQRVQACSFLRGAKVSCQGYFKISTLITLGVAMVSIQLTKVITNIKRMVWKSFSLRIQPPLIRFRYYVRNAKTDVCNSPPEIPYWWRKYVLNPDRSADWLTEQFRIISSTIIPCCDVQKCSGDNLSSPSFLRIRMFSLFVQCSMFNAGSMLHRVNEANFRLFIVLSAVRGFLSNYLPTSRGSR